MRVVVAPDKFEGSLRAGEAAAAIEAGLRRARPDAEGVRLALGDGGGGRPEALGAGGAAAAIEAGLRRARPDAEVVRLPLGDGGAGTLDALVAAGFQRVPARVTGPTGEPVEAAIAGDGPRARRGAAA